MMNHEINRTAAPQDIATKTKDFALVEVGFRLGEVAPFHLRA